MPKRILVCWPAFLLLGSPALADVVRLAPVQAETAHFVTDEAVPYLVSLDSASLSIQASVTQGMLVVYLRVKNNSDHTLPVSPRMLSASDPDKLMAKLLQSSDVTTLLQADFAAARSEEKMNREAAEGNAQTAESISEYIFGRFGMHAEAARLASGLVGTVVATASETQQALQPPEITPVRVAREAFDSQDLEPGYSAEGLVFFTAPHSLPLTLMVNVGGEKRSVVFQAPSTSLKDEGTATNEGTSAGIVRAPKTSACPANIQSGMRVEVFLTNGRHVKGKVGSCDGRLSIRSGMLYLTFDPADVSRIDVLGQ